MRTSRFLHEGVTRDGFQGLARFVPTKERFALLAVLGRCVLARIEVTSFAPPKAIPNLAEANVVMAGLARAPGVEYAVLVPNLPGLERALPHQPDEVNFALSASATHYLMNMRQTQARSLAEQRALVPAAAAGVAVQVAFRPPSAARWKAGFPRTRSSSCLRRSAASACAASRWPTPPGMANPAQLERLGARYLADGANPPTTIHFNNTRGAGLASLPAALRAGARRFDASLGGCPCAPDATGNICTEDPAAMLEEMGWHTGSDLRALLACSRRLLALTGREIPGQVTRAGRVSDVHPAPSWLEEMRAQAAASDAMAGLTVMGR